MHCWICGNKATTGEHLVKDSDLRLLFGQVTTKEPIYLNRGSKSVKLQSTNSKFIKGNAKLCVECNSARSQPFDKSWEHLSKYLQVNHEQFKNNGFIKLKNVFPGSTSQSMLNVHLYFNKIFGTRVAAENMPLNMDSFREAILKGVENPGLYLSFGYWPAKRKSAGITEIHSLQFNTLPDTFYWFYVLNKIAVMVTYCEVPNVKLLLRSSWKPSSLGKKVKYAEFPT